MSVNSKMTAIANNIRSLLGITGTMGLDAMVINTETELSNITNAFTAIGNKGGTVPESKVSGNLTAAINSIPAGVTVQKKTGTFSPSNGSASVNCGFKPDFVIIDLGTKDSTRVLLSFPFYEIDTSLTLYSMSKPISSSSYSSYLTSCQANCKLTDNGFQVSNFMNVAPSGYNYTENISGNINYIAIKYT